MRKNLFIGAVVSSLLPLAALADGAFTGTVTLGYGTNKLESGGFSQKLNTTTLSFESKLAVSSNFDIGLDLGLAKVDVKDSGGVELDITNVAVTPRYKFGNGVSFGAYYDHLAGSVNIAPISLKAKSYGLTLGYAMPKVDVEGFIGETRYEPSGPGFELKSRDIGVRADYNVSDRFQVGGHLAHSKITMSGAPGSLKGNSIGISGDYLIGNGLNLFGGLSHQKIKMSGAGSLEMNTASLGVGYAIPGSSGGNIGPVMLSLEAARSDISSSGGLGGLSADATSWTFGVSIPLGGAKSSAPLNSHAHSIRSGNRNIAHSVVGTLF